jgi:hypothetical protein
MAVLKFSRNRMTKGLFVAFNQANHSPPTNSQPATRQRVFLLLQNSLRKRRIMRIPSLLPPWRKNVGRSITGANANKSAVPGVSGAGADASAYMIGNTDERGGALVVMGTGVNVKFLSLLMVSPPAIGMESPIISSAHVLESVTNTSFHMRNNDLIFAITYSRT